MYKRQDYKEAAILDGCGDMGFLFRVAMPLSIPTISSLAIYLFVQIYNQYFWPMLVTSRDEMRTIQILSLIHIWLGSVR